MAGSSGGIFPSDKIKCERKKEKKKYKNWKCRERKFDNNVDYRKKGNSRGGGRRKNKTRKFQNNIPFLLFLFLSSVLHYMFLYTGQETPNDVLPQYKFEQNEKISKNWRSY